MKRESNFKNVLVKRTGSVALACAMVVSMAPTAVWAWDGSRTGATQISSSTTVDNGVYSSSTLDENALLVYGDVEVNLNSPTITKDGEGGNGDDYSFYGINSAFVACSGAVVNIDNATVNTSASGANGIFSYGGSATTSNTSSDGTTVNITNSTITTSSDGSGGLMTTGGGIMNASNCTVLTAGGSSAAIRTDRGGGTVVVDGGTYKATGSGSPGVYCTADVTVKNSWLRTTKSEGLIIEGKNSITVEDCTVNVNNSAQNGQSTTSKAIFIYQSMSGDADTGNASFSIKDTILNNYIGDIFYITNQTTTIEVENCDFNNYDSDGYFLRAAEGKWGNSGSNGGDVTMTMSNQTVEGDIFVGASSSLNLTLKDGSTLTGTIYADDGATVNIVVESGSTVNLTGDSYAVFSGEGTVNDNGYSTTNLLSYTQDSDTMASSNERTSAIAEGTSSSSYVDATDDASATAGVDGDGGASTVVDNGTTDNTDDASTAASDAVGDTITKGNVVYTITDTSAKTVAVTGLTTAGKAKKTLTIKNTVKSDNKVTYTVTSIESKALAKATKLKTLKVKAKSLKKVAKNALVKDKKLKKIIVPSKKVKKKFKKAVKKLGKKYSIVKVK